MKKLTEMDTCWVRKRAVSSTFDQLIFKGTVVNWALPSLHKGALEITLTVPLSYVLKNVKRSNPWNTIPRYATNNRP